MPPTAVAEHSPQPQGSNDYKLGAVLLGPAGSGKGTIVNINFVSVFSYGLL